VSTAYWGVLLAAPSGACVTLAFRDIAFTEDDSFASGTVDVALPDSVEAGDFLVVWLDNGTGVGYSIEDTFTKLTADGSFHELWYKIADGSEGGTTVQYLRSEFPYPNVICASASYSMSGTADDITFDQNYGNFGPGPTITVSLLDPDHYIAGGTVNFIFASRYYKSQTESEDTTDDTASLNYATERGSSYGDAYVNIIVGDSLGAGPMDNGPEIVWDDVGTGGGNTLAQFQAAVLVCVGAAPPAPGGVTDDFAEAPEQDPVFFNIYPPDQALPDLTGYSKETGEPDHAGNTGGHSAWFKFTAPSTGSIYIEAGWWDDQFTTLIGVYEGVVVNALTEVTPDSYEETDDYSDGSWTVTEGTVYHVAVDGKDGEVGTLYIFGDM
jgi:hypothetical protein